MKFDSYPRFVKSDLYKMCLVEQLADNLPFCEQDTTILKSSQFLDKKVRLFLFFIHVFIHFNFYCKLILKYKT